MNLTDLLEQISRELGTEPNINALQTSQEHIIELPKNIAEFYNYTDGLALPFITFRPLNSLTHNFYKNWSCFGQDNYFSYCLYNETGNIDLWDHASGMPPDATFESIIELIDFAYHEQIVDSNLDCQLIIKKIPIDINQSMSIIKELKPITNLSTSELLNSIKYAKNAPFMFNDVKRSDAIKIIRRLQPLNIECCIQIRI